MAGNRLAFKFSGILGILLTHVEASGYASSLQWLFLSVFAPGRHQAWHFILSELNLSPAEGSQANVSDLELVGWGAHF